MLQLSNFDREGVGFWWRRDLAVALTAVASAVLYMYCKAVKGELVGEIVAEFGRDYVSLPFDEQKMPYLVSVAEELHMRLDG